MSIPLDLARAPEHFTDNPYPCYRQILNECPVLEQPDGSYLVASYKLLNDIYRDTTRFSSDKRTVFAPVYGDSPLYQHHTTSLVFNDPPLHTRVRKIMAGAMTPSAIAHMENGLVELVERLLVDLAERGKDGEVDLIKHYAAQIPLICRCRNVDRSEPGRYQFWVRWSPL